MDDPKNPTPYPKFTIAEQIVQLRRIEMRDKHNNFVNPDFIADRLKEGLEEALAEERRKVEETIKTERELADEAEEGWKAWGSVAHRVGEELASVGPKGYYDMPADEWCKWALEAIKNLIQSARRDAMEACIQACLDEDADARTKHRAACDSEDPVSAAICASAGMAANRILKRVRSLSPALPPKKGDDKNV
jgi:hypothetical protein